MTEREGEQQPASQLSLLETKFLFIYSHYTTLKKNVSRGLKAGAAQADRVILMWAPVVDLSFFPTKASLEKPGPVHEL